MAARAKMTAEQQKSAKQMHDLMVKFGTTSLTAKTLVASGVYSCKDILLLNSCAFEAILDAKTNILANSYAEWKRVLTTRLKIAAPTASDLNALAVFTGSVKELAQKETNALLASVGISKAVSGFDFPEGLTSHDDRKKYTVTHFYARGYQLHRVPLAAQDHFSISVVAPLARLAAFGENPESHPNFNRMQKETGITHSALVGDGGGSRVVLEESGSYRTDDDFTDCQLMWKAWITTVLFMFSAETTRGGATDGVIEFEGAQIKIFMTQKGYDKLLYGGLRAQKINGTRDGVIAGMTKGWTKFLREIEEENGTHADRIAKDISEKDEYWRANDAEKGIVKDERRGANGKDDYAGGKFNKGRGRGGGGGGQVDNSVYALKACFDYFATGQCPRGFPQKGHTCNYRHVGSPPKTNPAKGKGKGGRGGGGYGGGYDWGTQGNWNTAPAPYWQPSAPLPPGPPPPPVAQGNTWYHGYHPYAGGRGGGK